MFRKTVATLATAAIVATTSLTATSTAEASSRNNRIIAGIALGVAAGLLGAEIRVDHGSKGQNFKKGNKGFKKQSFKKGNNGQTPPPVTKVERVN